MLVFHIINIISAHKIFFLRHKYLEFIASKINFVVRIFVVRKCKGRERKRLLIKIEHFKVIVWCSHCAWLNARNELLEWEKQRFRRSRPSEACKLSDWSKRRSYKKKNGNSNSFPVATWLIVSSFEAYLYAN